MKDVFTLIPRKAVERIKNHPKTFLAFNHLIKKASRNPQTGSIQTICELNRCYLSYGAYPLLKGPGVGYSMQKVDEHQATFSEISRFYKQIESVARQYIPHEDIYGLMQAKEFIGWKTMPLSDGSNGDLWAALSVGKNCFLNAHTYCDSWLSLTTVITEGKFTFNDEVACYYYFPSKGVTVSLCSGDILVFNPYVVHCLSSRKTSRDILSTSFYLKTDVVGGNDKNQQTTEEQEEWADKR